MVRPYTAMISVFEFSTALAARAAGLALMLGVAGLFSAGAAAAPGPRAATIEEVVVTARKREESIQDVPLAVTAYTGEELSRQGVYDLTQLDQQVPSLSIGRSQGSPTGIDITLRESPRPTTCSPPTARSACTWTASWCHTRSRSLRTCSTSRAWRC
jgi:outer membrane receptor protein involved in Fe transport